MKKKYCFVLLEVIIALALVASAALFIARVPYLQIRHQRRCLQKLEMARLDMLYLQKLQILLLQGSITAQEIEAMQKSTLLLEENIPSSTYLPPCNVRVIVKRHSFISSGDKKKIGKITAAVLITPKEYQGKTHSFDHTILIEKDENHQIK